MLKTLNIFIAFPSQFLYLQAIALLWHYLNILYAGLDVSIFYRMQP